jgi:metal-responsive CopG/Arc/MetJ family transcriptional regulator
MRTLVDLPDRDLKELAELGRRSRQSRASLIREAVAAYLAARRKGSETDAFGLWESKGPDGLAHQRKLRSEW